MSNTPKFSGPARRLLINFVRTKGNHGHGRLVSQAVASLNAIFRSHRTVLLDEAIQFEYNEELSFDDEYITDWKIVEGIGSVDYRGGDMFNQTFEKRNIGRINFFGIRFYDCDIDDFSYYGFFNRCNFESCRIKRIHTSDLSKFAFSNCEFSGTEIVFDQVMPDLRDAKNGFMQDLPPIAVGNTGPHIPWETVLRAYDEEGSKED